MKRPPSDYLVAAPASSGDVITSFTEMRAAVVAAPAFAVAASR
jgi:hypothetical protein